MRKIIKTKKTYTSSKIIAMSLAALMILSVFAGVALADTNNTNESKNISIIDKIISIINSIFSGAESDASTVDARNVTEMNITDQNESVYIEKSELSEPMIENATAKLIRSFSDEEEFEKYIGEPKEEQVVISSKSLRKIMSEKEIKFYDSKGDLLSTYFCERCEGSQSPNRKYIGVLETNKDFSQLNFTLFDQYGQVLWHKDNFHLTIEGSVPQVYISNDGKNVISATMRKKTAPYSILFHDSKGNLIKEYQEYKDAEKFDFHMAVSEQSPSGEYFLVAGPEGVFVFDWKGNLIWEYTFSPIYMRLVHKIHTSPDGKYIVVKVDECPEEEKKDVCLYFMDRNGTFIGRYSKEYLHGWDKFSEEGRSFLVATHTGLFLFDPSNAKKLWSYQFAKECVYIPSLTISPNGKWIALVRATSENEKTLYLFDNFGEKVWIEKFKGNDLGDLTQPAVDFLDDSNKLSVKFPEKILLFEVIQEGTKE